ncbi:uncharacterized protein LOC128299639 [Anopheles moucheti]|uniref:uncharacterized protein LOC128299639 n=1 Tax=Anopheles moucheti TaxID=186751 RepID=UPI0022F01F0D|nr:uncharacterized protein LOC128299639 [Anopheles moucheti]
MAPVPSIGVASSSSVSCITEIFLNDTPNHLTPATMVMLRAYQMYRDADICDFTITINDSEDGKFDDVVVRYTFVQHWRKEALFIDAKDWYIPAYEHEHGTERVITKETLMSNADAGAKHSIAKYFISFLHVKPLNNWEDVDKYVVCTNSRLEHAAVNYFNELVPENNHILSFTNALSSICYQLNPNKLPNDYDNQLKDACLKVLAELMVSHIVHRKLISDETPLFDVNRDSRITTRLADFYKAFILVCCPHGEKSLHNKTLWEIKQLSKTSSNAEQETIFKELQNKLMDALQNKKPIGPHCVGDAINITMHAGNMLKFVTCKYLQSLKEQCSMFIINRDRLKMTGLYTDLLSGYSRDILPYRGNGDVVLSMATIAQTLELVPSCEAVFIDSINPEIAQHLDQLLMQPSDVFQSSLIVIAIAAKLDNATQHRLERLIANGDATWKQRTTVKIIVLQQSTIDHHGEILVSDLTSDCRQELYERYATLHLFGTRTTLDAMVLPTDSLAHLKYVLDTSNDTQGKENVNIHQQRYDKIHSWYIHREINSRYTFNYCNFCTSISKHLTEECFELDSYQFHELKKFQRWRNTFHSSRQKEHHYNLWETEEKITNLDDVSGAGKTAYFTWLARDLQAQFPSLYVMHFNAAEHSSSLEWLAFDDLPIKIDTEVIRMLFRLYRLACTDRHVDARLTLEDIHEERRLTDRLAKLITIADGMVLLDESQASKLALTSNQLIQLRLFQEKVYLWQVVFMLDGVDEVETSLRTPMLRFVGVLADIGGARKIFVSTIKTRHVFRFPYAYTCELKPFYEDDASLLLHNLLLQQLNGYRHYVEKQTQNALLPFLYYVVSDAMRQDQNIPLLLYMAYSRYLPAIKRCVNFKKRLVHGSIRTHLRNIDTFLVLKQFIDEQLGTKSLLPPGVTNKKLAILNTPKRQLALLAVHTVLDKQYTDRLLTADERTNAMKLARDCNVGKLKVEFLTTNRDGTARFTNKLFAEYFAACWLFENRSRLGSKRNVKFACKIMVTSNSPLRWMFDRISIEGCAGTYAHSLLCWCVAQRHNSMSYFIEVQRLDHVPGKDATGRTILHWLSSVANRSLAMLFEIIPTEQIDAKDELFHWSALDYAFAAEQWPIMRNLIQLGAKVNIDVWVDQLRSYDLVELFNRMAQLEHRLMRRRDIYSSEGKIINDGVLARHVLSAVNSGIVQHLLYEKNIDIRKPLAELSDLNVLEYCAKRNLFRLLEHFISFADASNQLLGVIGPRLYELSIEHNAYNVAIYLMDQCGFRSNIITEHDRSKCICEWECICQYEASDFLLFTMELKNMELFRLFFNKFCAQCQYTCTKDEDIVEESFRSTRTNLRQIPDDVNRRFMQTIAIVLSESLHRTNFDIIDYVVQKIKRVSNRFLRDVIRMVSCQKSVLPAASSSLFNYLLDRTDDLQAVNDAGQTLLHTVGATGCTVMVRCLLDRGFDPLNACTKLKQNVLHYVAREVEDRHAVKMYHQLLPYCSIDQFNVPNNKGYDVCDIAIMNRKYRLARVLIHTLANGSSTQIRVSAVLDSFKRLLQENAKILGFLKSSLENTYDDWKDVYAIIHHRMPVV